MRLVCAVQGLLLSNIIEPSAHTKRSPNVTNVGQTCSTAKHDQLSCLVCRHWTETWRMQRSSTGQLFEGTYKWLTVCRTCSMPARRPCRNSSSAISRSAVTPLPELSVPLFSHNLSSSSLVQRAAYALCGQAIICMVFTTLLICSHTALVHIFKGFSLQKLSCISLDM